MILADSSIWIQMFRKGTFKAELNELITSDQLCIHPFIVAELACGSLPDRRNTLHFLDQLHTLQAVPLADVRTMIESRGLFSNGVGLTDAHLIASCLTTPGTRIWTMDVPLGTMAESLGLRATVP